MVILGDDLNNVAHSEANACLLTGNEVIFGRVILKLGTNIDLEGRDSQTLQFIAEAIINMDGERYGAHVNVNWL